MFPTRGDKSWPDEKSDSIGPWGCGVAVRLGGDTERANTAEKRSGTTVGGTPARGLTRPVNGVRTRGVIGGVERAKRAPAELILGDAGTLGDALGLHWAISGQGPSARISWMPAGIGETSGINLLPARAICIEHPAWAEADCDLTGVPRPEMDALLAEPLAGKTVAAELAPASAAIDEPELITAASVVFRARFGGTPNNLTTTTVMSSASNSACVTFLELSTSDCAMPAHGTPHSLRC